jgi:hypothetical protein
MIEEDTLLLLQSTAAAACMGAGSGSKGTHVV